jgi:hypothetical protein
MKSIRAEMEKAAVTWLKGHAAYREHLSNTIALLEVFTS